MISDCRNNSLNQTEEALAGIFVTIFMEDDLEIMIIIILSPRFQQLKTMLAAFKERKEIKLIYECIANMILISRKILFLNIYSQKEKYILGEKRNYRSLRRRAYYCVLST